MGNESESDCERDGALLRRLFRDDQDRPAGGMADEAFMRRVMQRVEAERRRRLLLGAVPAVLTLTLALIVLLPVLSALPSVMTQALLDAPAAIPRWLPDSSGLLLLSVLLAVALPAVVDRLSRLSH